MTEGRRGRNRLHTRIDNLGDARAIADRYGVSRQRVHQWSELAGFPRPVARLNGGNVWLLDQVAEWYVERVTTRRVVVDG